MLSPRPALPVRAAVLALFALVLGALWGGPGAAEPVATALRAEPARAASGAAARGFDGVVEALRQTVIAAQVAGAVVQLDVKVGDRVKAGQLLLRIDARAADQTAAAGDAQVLSARATQESARRDFERQQQLFQQNYISRAALDRAEAEFKTSQAQAASLLAQAGATRTQSSFYLVRAPYAGVVSELPVALGDMALPGKPLLTIHDPGALRIAASVPLSVAASLVPGQPLRAELPGLPAARQWLTTLGLQVLPTVDTATHTVQVRADLPAGLAGAGLTPGLFARLWLPATAGDGAAAAPRSLTVPTTAVVRRAEVTGLYVLDADGRPQLRQVRLGRVEGDRVEVLTGLTAGERVALDPQTAARVR
jgi:RND family efflux transporter MFP subunit